MTTSFLEVLSYIFGWIYTLSWSLSFYPQPILNFKRKSTSGTTIDFPVINVFGFAAYFSSNAAFLYSPVIREQYALRNNGHTPTVQFNDLVFAGHATLITALTLTQYFPWIWGFDKGGRRGIGVRVSFAVKAVLLCSVLGVGTMAAMAALFPSVDGRTGIQWIDVVSISPRPLGLPRTYSSFYRYMLFPTSNYLSP
jgi:cystinosin